jgi:DNA-binding transcriptional regulator YhcF (GntR family)
LHYNNKESRSPQTGTPENHDDKGGGTIASKSTIPLLDKRGYIDECYHLGASAQAKWLYAYLIDRMWPYPTRKRLHTGWVMPGFLSVNRMHEHTGLHRETVKKCLAELQEWGLIAIFRKQPTRISAILLAPPYEYHFHDDDPSQAIENYLESS